jgi:hypothetical protein
MNLLSATKLFEIQNIMVRIFGIIYTRNVKYHYPMRPLVFWKVNHFFYIKWVMV